MMEKIKDCSSIILTLSCLKCDFATFSHVQWNLVNLDARNLWHPDINSVMVFFKYVYSLLTWKYDPGLEIKTGALVSLVKNVKS